MMQEDDNGVASAALSTIERLRKDMDVSKVRNATVISRSQLDALEAALRERACTPPPEAHLEGVDISRLPVGTPVEKVGGYPFPGTVVAAFHTLSGQERFVVEATGEAYAGMLHIFNGGQLRAALATTESRS